MTHTQTWTSICLREPRSGRTLAGPSLSSLSSSSPPACNLANRTFGPPIVFVCQTGSLITWSYCSVRTTILCVDDTLATHVYYPVANTGHFLVISAVRDDRRRLDGLHPQFLRPSGRVSPPSPHDVVVVSCEPACQTSPLLRMRPFRPQPRAGSQLHGVSTGSRGARDRRGCRIRCWDHRTG